MYKLVCSRSSPHCVFPADYSRGFGGRYGVQKDRQDKVLDSLLICRFCEYFLHVTIGLCSIYQVTMSPELRHKERNNVLSL